MAELVILVCDVCSSQKNVTGAQLIRSGKKYKAELCEKCFTTMSEKYGFALPTKGWAKKEIVDFDEIKRNTT